MDGVFYAVYSTSDLRGFWPILDHANWPGVKLLELPLVDVEEVVKLILGAKTLLVGLSSAFKAG